MTLRALLERIGLLDPKPDGLVDAARLSADRNGIINRRAFLGLVGATVAVATIDPEALLWTPAERTIVIPEYWSGGNVLVTPEWIMKEKARVLVNNLEFAKNVHRSYDDNFTLPYRTVSVRLPQRYVVNRGQPHP